MNLAERLEVVDVYSPEYTLDCLVELRYLTKQEVDFLLDRYSAKEIVNRVYQHLFEE
ncbi:MAG: hypothetical protein PHH06_00205 [Candidatus Gracilibacteria bacterium]|nr:hypothetical protein [Candidatus Gracilibacteria bacterium]